MSLSVPNRFGRKPGRGIRSWLLLPKVIAACFYLGGLAAAAVVWLSSRIGQMGLDDPRRRVVINLAGDLFRFLVVPAILAAMGFGMMLFLQHPRQFIRMRWLVVKLIGLAILIPSAHFFLSSRMALLRRPANAGAAAQFGWGLIVVIAASIGIVILGRLKPRLGQNWAKVHSAGGGPPNATASTAKQA